MRRMNREIKQDRTDRPSILGPVINSSQHQERRHGLHAIGQGQKHRNRRQRAQAGQNANEVSGQNADEAPEKIVRLDRDAESKPEGGESGGDHSGHQRINGNGTLRP